MVFNKKVLSGILAAVVVLSQSAFAADIRITGNVIDANGAVIEGAKLHLVKANLDTTSNAMGQFVVTNVSVVRSLSSRVMPVAPRISGATLYLTISKPSENVQVQVYDLAGRFVSSAYSGMLSAGTWAIQTLGRDLSAKIYVLRVKIGNQMTTMKTSLVEKSRISSYDGMTADRNGSADVLKKVAADLDTLLISKTGFKSDTIPITEYVTDLGDQILDSIPPLIEMGILSHRTGYNIDPAWRTPFVWGGSVIIDSTDAAPADIHDGGPISWKVNCNAGWGAGWNMASLKATGVDLSRYKGGSIHFWIKGNTGGLTAGVFWKIVTGPKAGTDDAGYVPLASLGYKTDLQWHEITLPISSIKNGDGLEPDLARISVYIVFYAFGTDYAAGTYYIPDDITWVPAPK